MTAASEMVTYWGGPRDSVRTTIGLSLPDGYRIPAPEAPEGAYVLGLNPRWLNTPLATSPADTDRPSRRVLAWSMGGTFAPWAQG